MVAVDDIDSSELSDVNSGFTQCDVVFSFSRIPKLESAYYNYQDSRGN